MSSQHQNEQGFSTVELLIALFIAAAFIASAFQLFSVVMENGNEARMRSRAGNIAQEHIRSNTHLIQNPCTDSLSGETITPTDLPQPDVTVSFACPFGNNSRITRITAVVEYGVKREIVKESLDVYR